MTGVTDGELTQVQAAELMGVCYRQGKRIWQRYQADGDARSVATDAVALRPALFQQLPGVGEWHDIHRPRHRWFMESADCTLHDHVVLKLFGHLVAALTQFPQSLDHRHPGRRPMDSSARARSSKR